MMKTIDLRSDTVTLPTLAMRETILTAPLGDDVYEEDLTVNELQSRAARIMGKEAALFLPTGTMGNLVALMTHTEPGEEVILEEEAHIYYYEVGGMARIAGLIPKTLKGIRGHLTAEIVKKALRSDNIHFPKTSLVCLENTHNRAGGTVMPMEQLIELSEFCRSAGLNTHMDGARVFNAAVALGVEPKEIAQHIDSVTFCLSKGMAAPAGSLLVGGEPFIRKARKMRKLLGGGMRQAGVLAAAGRIALEEAKDRLARDHKLAKRLAEELCKFPQIIINPKDVETNILVFQIDPSWGKAEKFTGMLKEKGVLSGDMGTQTVRFVTHYQIETEDIPFIVKAVQEVVESVSVR
ncbi:MAG: low-specificity L-threonine aldolase [Dehalobacterium sp.]